MIKTRIGSFIAVATLSAAGFALAESPATQPAKAYPRTTCMITGEPLGGDMGEPVVINYQGQEVKFCCGSCVAKFKKDPDKYLKELAAGPTTKPAA